MIDPQHDEAVVLSYQRALGTLLRLISGFATAGVLVYLLGWLRSFGYYGAFKAEWILPNLPFAELASRGIAPIFALLLGLFLSFTDIANHRIGSKLATVMLVTLAMWCMALVASIVLPEFGYHTNAANFAFVCVVASASFAMSKFGEVVFELSKNDFKWRSNQIVAMFWALVFFGAMTFYLGSMEGERDKREATSRLPAVALDDRSSNDIWRLLAAHGELSYLVKLSPDLLSIKIIKSEHMGTIAPDIKTLLEKIQQGHPSDKELQINVQSTPEGLARSVYLSPLANLSCCYSWTEGSLLCPYSFSQAR